MGSNTCCVITANVVSSLPSSLALISLQHVPLIPTTKLVNHSHPDTQRVLIHQGENSPACNAITRIPGLTIL